LRWLRLPWLWLPCLPLRRLRWLRWWLLRVLGFLPSLLSGGTFWLRIPINDLLAGLVHRPGQFVCTPAMSAFPKEPAFTSVYFHPYRKMLARSPVTMSRRPNMLPCAGDPNLYTR